MAMLHRTPPVLALLLLSACRNDPLSVGVDLQANPDLATAAPRDLAAARDLRQTPTDLAGFCADPSSPRIELNGMFAASPFVSASVLALGCCEAAIIEVISMQISTKIVVSWRHQVGQGPDPPITLDLANLPAGWSVSVQSGCGPTDPGCQPTDRHDAGLVGTLTIAGDPGGYRMSTCLSVTESAGDPHPVIHSLHLWSPGVSTR